MASCLFDPKRLLQARFKGVPFEVEDDTISGGRRIVTHEYPDRESWDNEDMGRLAETASVRGYVFGADADARAARLFQVCAAPGAGLLVLPARTPGRARCLTVNSTFVSDEMGRIPVDMEFVWESAERGGLISVIMLIGAVASAGSQATAAAVAQFDRDFNAIMRRFSPADLVPGVARDAAAVTIRLAASALDGARRKIRFRSALAAAAVELAVRQLADNAVVLAYQGARADRIEPTVFASDEVTVRSGLAQALQAIFAAFATGATEPTELARELAALERFQAQPITSPFDCRSVRAERVLTREVATLVRRLALITRALAQGEANYGNRSEALGARADLAAAFAAQIAEADDPAVADALASVRDEAITLLSRRGAELPSTVLVETGASMPAAVLATTLYKRASADGELVARNSVAHPLFMPLTVEAIRP